MPEETETATETLEATTEAPETPAVDTAPSAETPDPLAAETEARIRAEERARVLGEELAAARAPKPEPAAAPKTYTAADVRVAFDKGEITDDQRVAYLADLQVQARLRERDAQALTAQREGKFQTKYNAYLTRHPELRTKGPTADKVWAAAADLAEEEGLDPEDKRTQLRAMERVFGPLPGDAMPPTNGEVHRRRIPTGTGYGAPPAPAPVAPKPGEKGKGLFDRLTPEAQGFYRAMHGGNLTKVYTTLEFADEGALRAKGRLTR